MAIPKKVREALKERAGDCCEICNAPANNAHHRKNRSQGGQDVLSNLLLLCGSGTTGCHGWVTNHPRTSMERGWSVPSWRDPAETPVTVYCTRLVLLSDDGSVVGVA